ncbi:MAG: TIGR03619 family F420-dependent LLM class oxidoreductase [Dehalococcoidia bacterium]|jgi:probable F420-dependent oxidoreductase|nr:TIGR03619 family F420-dependent LLM class oxidoreductase [Dehalococcoidia bacterium]
MDQGYMGAGFAVPQVFPDGNIDLSVVRDVSVRAEQMGYDSLWTVEQVIGTSQSLEPLALLSYLAAVTERARLGVSVLVLPFRSPPQLAKITATIDVLSAGRLTVGVGMGGGDANAPAFGIEPGRRVRRFIEALGAVDALWKEESTEFDGEVYTLSGTPMEPKPVQKPRPPVWFGARAEPAIRRAARYGDGFMGAGGSNAEDFKRCVGILRNALEDEGRDPAAFPVSKRVAVAIDDDADRAGRRLADWFGHQYGAPEMAARVAIFGPADHCFEQIDEIIDAGAEHLLLNPVFDYDEHLDALKRYTRS